MAQKPVRLRFTEDDLAEKPVAKAAAKAEKAADQAEKAIEKLPKKRKLRREPIPAGSSKKKLRFEKLPVEKPTGKRRVARTAAHTAVNTVSGTAHRETCQYEEDNVGIQAAHRTEAAAETAAHVVGHAGYSHKLKQFDKAEKLVRKSDEANVEALC